MYKVQSASERPCGCKWALQRSLAISERPWGPWYQVLAVACLLLSAKHKVQSTKYKALSAKYKVQSTKCGAVYGVDIDHLKKMWEGREGGAVYGVDVDHLKNMWEGREGGAVYGVDVDHIKKNVRR